MADPRPDQGFFPGLLGKVGNWFGSYDPQAAYGGLLSDPEVKQQFRLREMGAVAASMAANSMPVPYKGGMPWGSFLGAAGGAAATAGDSLMKARLEAAQAGLANQQVDATKAMMPMYQALFDEAKRNAGAGGGGASGTGGATGAPAKATDITPLARLGTGDTKSTDAILSGPLGDKIRAAAAKYNLDPVMLAAQVNAESSGDPTKIGPANKDGVRPVGLMQLMPDTAKAMGVKDPLDPEQNLDGGAKYLRQGLDASNGDLPNALKYYYSGSTDEKAWGPLTNAYPSRVFSLAPKPDQTAAVPPAVPGAPAPAAAAVPPPRSLLDPRGAPLPGGALGPGAEGADAAVTPPPAAAGAYKPQDASGGAYNVPPPPGPPPKPGEYAKPVTALPGGATPVSAGGAPPGLRLPDPTSAAPPELATPPSATPGRAAAAPTLGLLGGGEVGSPLGSAGPQVAGIPSRGPLAQFAGPGAAEPAAPPPAAVTQGAPPHTGAAGAAELAGLLAQQPTGAVNPQAGPAGLMTPQGPAAPGPQATPPVTQGPQATPGPPAAPLGAPPMPQMPTLSLPQTQMPQITPPQMPQATPGQAAAMGIAGISALIGKPAPEWIQKMAAMPGEQAMEAFKSYLQVQTQGMTEVNKKYIEMQAAPYIAAVSAAAKMPYTFVRAGESLPSGFDANGKPTGWIQAPGEPMMLDGPPTADGQPTKRYWIPATRQLIDLGASGASPAQTAAGTEAGKHAPTGVPGSPLIGTPGFTPPPNAPDPAKPIQTPRGTMMPGTDRQTLPSNYIDYDKVQDHWNEWNHDLVTAQTMAQSADAQINMIIKAAKDNETGAGTEARAQLGNFLISNFGVNQAWVDQHITKVADVQQFLYGQARETLSTLAAVNKRFTGGEFKITSQSGASTEYLNAANLPILAQDLAKVRQIQAVAENWNQAQRTQYADGSTWRNPLAFVSNWYEMNPLGKMQAQTMQQIGPLAGMTGVPGVPEGATPTGKTIGGWPEFSLPGRQGTYTFPGQWKDR